MPQFKLEVEEVQSAKPSLERWRAERNLGLPLVLEVSFFMIKAQGARI